MASKVSICNSSLLKIGANTIISLTADSEEARQCNARFDDMLDYLLQIHPWNFAMARATLAQLATTPDFEFTYEYQLPTDPYCLQVVEYYPRASAYRYKVEGRKLLTNEGTVEIKYIKRVTDMNELGPLFREMFAYYLAAELSWSLTGSATLKQNMEANFLEAMRMAKLRDSQEDTPDAVAQGSWITSRY